MGFLLMQEVKKKISKCKEDKSPILDLSKFDVSVVFVFVCVCVCIGNCQAMCMLVH